MGSMDTAGSGGLVGASGNLLGGIVNGIFGAVQQKKQMQHDKDMAALNQGYALEQMEKQNQYQVEQWNRENAYNDPSAVANRYRAAGINPRAAMGGAASGTGVAGGLSSAPSGSGMGSASNIMRNDLAGLESLGLDIISGMRLTAQIDKDKADALKAYEDAKNVKLDSQKKEIERDLGLWLSQIESDKEQADAKKVLSQLAVAKEKSRAPYYDMTASVEFSERLDAARKVKADADTQEQLVLNAKKDGYLKDTEADKLLAEITTERNRADLVVAQAEHERSLSSLARGQAALVNRQTQKVLFDMINEGINTGLKAADVINDIVSTWVPNPSMASKMITKITELFNSKGKKISTKVEKTQK